MTILKNWQDSLRPREIEKEALFYLFKPFILIILGSRQVGKTSLLRRLMANLVFQKKINPKQILYFDFEIIADLAALTTVTPENVKTVLVSYGTEAKKTTFLFIDEIQYHPNPSNLLKVIFDHLPWVKLAVSGSSTWKIKAKFKDSLAGRHKTFVLPPLSFPEFLDFKSQLALKINLKLKKPAPRIKEELKSFFEEYVVFGGYPKVALSSIKKEKISALESIFTSYVRRDIKDFAAIEEPGKFNKLISLLAFQAGNLINYSELSSSSGLNRKTLEKYLFLLENTFIISLLKPYFTNQRKEIVKMPKVYFQDTGLRNYIVNNFSSLARRVDSGSLFENAVFNILAKKESRLENLRFWRTLLKSEVDFIRLGKENKPIPYEVKQTIRRKKIPPGLLSFIRAYSPAQAFVVNEDCQQTVNYQKTKVISLPAWSL